MTIVVNKVAVLRQLSLSRSASFPPVSIVPTMHPPVPLTHSSAINRIFTTCTTHYYYGDRMRWAEHVASIEADYKLI